MSCCPICGLLYSGSRNASRFFIYDALIPWCLPPGQRRSYQEGLWW